MACLVYFLVVLIVGSYSVMNLFIVILLSNFSKQVRMFRSSRVLDTAPARLQDSAQREQGELMALATKIALQPVLPSDAKALNILRSRVCSQLTCPTCSVCHSC